MENELPAPDRVRLLHMLQAAQQALEFAAGRERASLDQDAMFRRAVINCLQEIGEAAVRVTEDTRRRCPSLPWNQIVGMRNRLVHVYFAINLDLVWEALVRDLDPLVRELQTILNSDVR